VATARHRLSRHLDDDQSPPLLERRTCAAEAAAVSDFLHYTHMFVVLSGLLVLGFYHMIQRFKVEYFRRVTAVGYSCVVFGWMTILAAKQPSLKLNIFGVLSISFAPFESLIFTSIMVLQASFIGHLSGIIVGYSIAWDQIHWMNNY
jgi:membrane associated rhomboid family serine protease